jgi:hypothetical protein
MLHYTKSRLHTTGTGMQYTDSAEFKKKFYLQLHAMQLSVKFKPKIFLTTLLYAAPIKS